MHHVKSDQDAALSQSNTNETATLNTAVLNMYTL